MGGKVKLAAVALAAAACAAVWAAQSPPPGGDDRQAIIQALLQRDRSLANVHFQVPVGVYRQYLQDEHASSLPPLPFLATSALYTLEVGRRDVTLRAELELRVLDASCPAIGVLAALDQGWQELTINGKEAHLPAVDGFLRFLPPGEGVYAIAAKAPLGRPRRRGATVQLAVLQTARTTVAFDAPSAWEVLVDPGERQLPSSAGGGTHGRIALPPLKAPLRVRYQPPTPQTQRPPRFELSGAVTWNIDAGGQQVTAALDVTVAGTAAERLELEVSPSADRLEITGPDVTQVSARRGGAIVQFRGNVLGRTALRVAYELPAGSGDTLDLGPLNVTGGHWTDGTVAVTNTAGASEVLPAATAGLEEIALADLPPAHRAMLPAPAVLAYRIAARQFEASVEVLELGEFALRQSIADLAHYEVFCAPDGAMLGRVRYEVRNRTSQFLTLTLPAGAQLLLARVNDQPCPASLSADGAAWLLPLERSRASIMGLVSFPIEVVYFGRLPPLAPAKEIQLPLPQIDLPIAYGWCQAYLPEGLVARRWSGPMKCVERLSSESAKASLQYGRAELARKPAEAGIESAQVARAVLARNYYLTGAGDYDRGDYQAAQDKLQQVIRLAPESVEAANAQRMLANWEMLRGQLAPRTAPQKAAAAQVQREVAEATRTLGEEQADMLSQAMEAARAGNVQEAATKLKAADVLEAKLAQRGVSKKELAARSRRVQEESQRVQQQVDVQRSQLRQKMSQLRQAGEYDAAMAAGRTLRDLEGESPQLQDEMEGLAIASSRKQQERRLEYQPGVGGKLAPAPAGAPVQPPPAEAEPSVHAEFDVRDLLLPARPAAPGQPPQQPPEGSNEQSLLATIKQNVDPQSWEAHGRDVRIIDGVLVAQTTAANRQAIADLLGRLRQARGPAVEFGNQIIQQQAKGLAAGPVRGGAPADEKELQRFIARNYGWQIAAGPQAASQPGGRVGVRAPSLGLDVSGLLERLESNLGQKVTVDSFNVAASAAEAEALGVSFHSGRNDLSWAVIDEAQLRSLLELAEARATGGGRAAVSPARRQETIVGTDALLAIAMAANVAFAGERHNTLNVADNIIALPHDRYLVLVSDSQLTVVRAGAMQFWTEAPQAVAPAPVPQSIEVPRVGQLVQFEKTLLDPADRLVLRAQTSWKGVAP